MPDIPEHLLRRSAEARAEALGVPLEQVLAEMGLAAEGETTPATLEEITLPVQPANPDTTIPDDLQAREATARQSVVDEFEAKPAPAPPASIGVPAEPAPVAEPPAPPMAEEPVPVVEAPVPVVEEPAAAAAAVAAPPIGEPTAPAQAPAPVGTRTTTVTAPPVAAPQGTPEGVRPQRLLTVVRAKAIQQVKAEPTDKVSVWPHLLLIEFVALLGVTAFLTVLSVILQAPLLDLANFNLTPNPSKAPWYFLGLQELLSYFDPQIGGVTVPGIAGLLGLMAVPYVDRNPSTKPSDRKFAIMFFTFFLVASATLTMIGVLFRGPGFNFSYPWSDGIWFDDLKDWISFG